MSSYCYRSTKIEKEGKEVVDDLLDGRVKNFEVYARKTLGETQLIGTRSNKIGTSVVRYLQTIDDEDYVDTVLEKIMETERCNFVEIFRVASDLAVKYPRYKDNNKMKKSYLLMHPDVSNIAYDMALWMAGKLKCHNVIV